MAAHSRKLPAELHRKLSAHGRALLREGLSGSAAPPPARAFAPDPDATARWLSRHSGDYVAYLVPRRLGPLNGGYAHVALPDRDRQDGTGADFPREWRRC